MYKPSTNASVPRNPIVAYSFDPLKNEPNGITSKTFFYFNEPILDRVQMFVMFTKDVKDEINAYNIICFICPQTIYIMLLLSVVCIIYIYMKIMVRTCRTNSKLRPIGTF